MIKNKSELKFLQKIHADANLEKPKTVGGKIFAELRLRVLKKKIFVGTYWGNNEALLQWVADSPVIVLKKKNEDIPLKKIDYHMRDTEALKKSRKLVVWYVEDNAFNTNVLGFSKGYEHARLGID